jgi:hypothetical protein
MAGVPRDKVFALWELLAAGRIEDIDREPWQPGNAPDADPGAAPDRGDTKRKPGPRRRGR